MPDKESPRKIYKSKNHILFVYPEDDDEYPHKIYKSKNHILFVYPEDEKEYPLDKNHPHP